MEQATIFFSAVMGQFILNGKQDPPDQFKALFYGSIF